MATKKQWKRVTHSNSNLRSGRFLFVCSTPGWCCRIGLAAFVLWRVGVLQHLGARADPGFWNGRWIFVIMSEKSNRIYFNIWGIRKKRKKEAQKKGGENSPISPPLDPRLTTSLLWYSPLFIDTESSSTSLRKSSMLLRFSICQWRHFRKFGEYFWLTRLGKLWNADFNMKSCVHG